MAKKKNPMTNPLQSISDSSSDDDGAPIYTPPETEPNDGPSSSIHSLDPSHLSEVIQGIQNVRLATEKSDDLAQESIKDISAKPKKGRRSRAKRSDPADIAVDNATDTLQTLVVADGETDNLKKERTKSKSAKNRKRGERKKRRKAKLAEENAKNETGAEISNGKSKKRILKNAGYRGVKQFMDSYGLRLHDHQDIAAANEIIKHMSQKAGASSSNNHTGPIEEKYPKSEEGVGEKKISNYEWLKLSEWHDMKHFMIAHGLKWGEVDDFDEARVLIENLKQDQVSERKSKQLHVSKEEEIKKVKDSPTKLTTGKTKKKNVVGLWSDYFGNETQLANWQRLCVDVGMEEALGKVWVNIFDFLDAKAVGKPVKRYESERKLAAYTMKSGKIYPKKQAKEGGPVRALLAHIFSH